MTLKTALVQIKEKLRLINIGFRNMNDNMRYISIYKYKTSDDYDYQILLLAHSLEKGLCLKDVRLGFGKSKINNLLKLLGDYSLKGFNTNSYAFKEGVSVIEAYINFHKKVNYDVKCFEEWIDKIKKINKCEKTIEIAGVKTYTSKELKKDDFIEFEKFISRRHSIRNFSDEDITENEILKAISIAQKAPSACNRQPSKVYYSLSKEKNSIIDNIIPGNQGFKGKVNKYIIVTSDIGAFGSIEVNQWYVNGGIYSSFLILALHSIGIGTCIFQWADIKDRDKELRSVANIPDNEKVILVIGIGNYPNEISIPIAMRKNIEEVIKTF